ncbi:hypothetical protein C8F01DRAFT_991026 [Mycena amicta]|nr:hypothetical protein C8F01DRAFT_991026 [Mycena amicta]
MPDSSRTNLQSVKRHPKYHISGGDLHIIADDIEFCVHRYFFERSAKFRGLLASPSPGQLQQGTKLTAIKLSEVNAAEFEKFVMVFYNPLYTLYPDTTAADWADILHLAYDWQFDEVALLAIRELEKHEMSVVDRIALYQKHGLALDAPLLFGHYAALCARGYPLDLAESKKLALETVVLVNQVMHVLPKTATSSKVVDTSNASLISKIVAEIPAATKKQVPR